MLADLPMDPGPMDPGPMDPGPMDPPMAWAAATSIAEGGERAHLHAYAYGMHMCPPMFAVRPCLLYVCLGGHGGLIESWWWS